MKRTSLSLAVMLTLAACSNGTDDAADDKTSAQGGEKPTTVRVLTHDSFVLSDEHIAQFEEETGYTLETIAPGDGGLVVNQLILNKDNPSADAVFGLDNFLVPTALDEGVLAEASTDAVPDSATDLVVEGRAIPIDRGDVCINADLTWFAEEGMELPSSLEDLAKPEYAELLAVTDPVTSSPGFAFLTGTISVFGEEWTEYWSDLVAGGTRVADGWSDAYYSDFSGSDGEGPFPLVLSYSSSPSAEVDDSGEARTAILEDTCVRQVEYASIVEGGANPEGAQAFIDFMLSDDVQAALPETMYMYPINDEIELPEVWAAHAKLSDNPIEVDSAEVARMRSDWLDQWTDAVQ